MKTAKMTPHAFGTSGLSPDARPFHPCSLEHEDFAYVYNNGVPSLVLTSERDVAEVLYGIQDNAIDENFPPTAEEAAEMEAVQAFVDLMATLSFLEEQEEKSRINFESFEKRWECRRAEGLTGKPNPAKGLVQAKNHTPRQAQNIKTLVKKLVIPYSSKDTMTKKPNKLAAGKKPKHVSGVRSPIQQPRKQY
jgi:hypothetical protein